MAIAAQYGWAGYCKVGGAAMPYLPNSGVIDPDNPLIPPLIQNSVWAHNYAPGMRTPIITIQTNPLVNAPWFTAGTLTSWFGRPTVTSTVPTLQLDFHNGSEAKGYIVKPDSITLSCANGGLVFCNMVFMAGTLAAPGAAPAIATTTPMNWTHCSFGAQVTGWSSFQLTLSNNLLISPQASTNVFPEQLDEGPIAGSLEIVTVSAGSAPAAGVSNITLMIGNISFILRLLRTESAMSPTWSPNVKRHSYLLFAGTSANAISIV